MDLGIRNRVVLITGSSSGIGAEIALRFAQEGAIPILTGRDKKRGLEILEQVNQFCSKSFFVEAELSDPSACRHLVNQTIEQLGKIDVLVNNAGGNDLVGLEAGPEAFMKSLKQNLAHVYNMAHYSLPYLKQTKGNIVNIGSKVADTGQGKTSGYAAAKGAMRALTREWAADLAPFFIRVNEVIPAEVWTLSYQNWIQSFPDAEKKLKDIVGHIPLGHRFTTTREIADMVLFLASPLSGHTTGQHIFVDGGYTHLDRALPTG